MDKVTENLKNAELRRQLEQKYTTARMNLLIVVIFTVVNLAFLLAKDFTYFLFSAAVPYYLVGTGMVICGLYPPEWYVDQGLVGVEFYDTSLLAVLTVIAAVILVVYLLCFIFSKNMNGGWLIAALVLFGIDTVALLALGGISTSGIVDVVFHVWVIYYLAIGISAYSKMKSVPIQHATSEELLLVDENGERYDSTPLRAADTSARSRTLLEASELGHSIVYRRVKRTNELVIDGMVYDEYTALVEFPHTLIAVIGGHVIEAGTNQGSRMTISVDGEPKANKRRLI